MELEQQYAILNDKGPLTQLRLGINMDEKQPLPELRSLSQHEAEIVKLRTYALVEQGQDADGRSVLYRALKGKDIMAFSEMLFSEEELDEDLKELQRLAVYGDVANDMGRQKEEKGEEKKWSPAQGWELIEETKANGSLPEKIFARAMEIALREHLQPKERSPGRGR